MFIPKGKAVHENLATTYVLVDALVSDLCEGGFSGIVELVLRDADAQILISSGNVVGVLEQRGLDGKTGALNRRLYSRATVPELAARARYERGRISIFACSGETALAAAGLAGAEQLYAELSTDFADLQKMISKLARERDRQWFIELRLGDGSSALLHLKDDRCRVITSHPDSGQHEIETAGLADNPALARSVFNRFPYLEPLNHLQVELLRRYRSGDDDDLVKRGILLTMSGLATALRNSG